MKHESAYPSYPTYKDSGIEWLGAVPEHWYIAKIKHYCRFLDNRRIPLSSEERGCRQGEFRYYGASGVIDYIDDYIFEGKLVLVGEDGANLVNRSTPIAFTADGKYWVNNHAHVLEPHDEVSEFWAARIESIDVMPWVSGSAQPKLTIDALANLNVAVPSLAERYAVVAFLNRETTKIDTLIQKQERLVSLLIEKRQAVISHAVTKGLDRKVPVKNSCVEWIGEVPEHWTLVSLGGMTEMFQTGPFGSQLHSSEYVEDGTPVINPSNIRDGRIVPDWSNTVTDEVIGRLPQHVMQIGDLVVGRRGELGRCAVVKFKEEGWMCGTGCLRIMLQPDYFSEYVAALFLTSGLREALSQESVGATMDNLNTSILSHLKIVVPPLSEQKSIVAFLGQETSKIDKLIEKAKQSIELMKERRSALISAAVTGKIDVRQVA